LSKFIYADLFEWLVVQINKSFEVGELMITGRSISILDRFESFKVYKSYLSVWWDF
jgi:myosin-5